MAPILRISDGSTTISLLGPVFQLKEWTPGFPRAKNDGTRQDAPLADNVRLVDKRWDNVAEVFTLAVRDVSQDQIFNEFQILHGLLNKASQYWTTDWQNEPVWIEKRASNETYSTYAIVVDYQLEGFGNYFAQPFLQPDCSAVMEEVQLTIERHSSWLSEQPGKDISAQTDNEFTFTYSDWEIVTTLPTDYVRDITETSTGRLLACEGNSTIWYSDDGSTWNSTTVPTAGTTLYSLLSASDGYIYAAGDNGLFRSNDNGVTWAIVSSSMVTTKLHSLLQDASGYMYMVCTDGLYRSANGTTWSKIVDGTVSGLTLFNGYIYTTYKTISSGPLYVLRSSDGATWETVWSSELVSITSSYEAEFIKSAGDYLYISINSTSTSPYTYRIFVSNDGVLWHEIQQLSSYIYNYFEIMMADDTYYLCGNILYTSTDGLSWEKIDGLYGYLSYCLHEWSVDGKVYMGTETDIIKEPNSITTDSNTVYLSNKGIDKANINHIIVYDHSALTYTEVYPMSSFPTALLPASPAQDDAVYFCCNMAGRSTNVLPFNSLIFDIGTAYDDTNRDGIDLKWEYWDGTAWSTLHVTDYTNMLMTTGVNSVCFQSPDDWARITIDSIPAWWIRLRVDYTTTNATPPTQVNNQIYTAFTPHVTIKDNISGDLPALARIEMYNRSDKHGVRQDSATDLPSLYANRLICGTRSLTRGSRFRSFLAADTRSLNTDVIVVDANSDDFGVYITMDSSGTTTSTLNAARGVAGYCLQFQPAAATEMSDQMSFIIPAGASSDYYGDYHTYLRCREHGGTPGNIGVRLKITLGLDSTVIYTETKRIDTENDWYLLDLGRVSIPISSSMIPSDAISAVEIVLQCSATDNSTVLNIYDLILIPTDEWAGDFEDPVCNQDSVLGYGRKLDIDSTVNAKRSVRSFIRSEALSGQVHSVWATSTTGPCSLQSNVQQGLYCLFAHKFVGRGSHDGADGASTLSDSSGNFVNRGFKKGQTIFNVTDGSSAVITDVTETTIEGTLNGGTDNDWDAGDVYYCITDNWVSYPWLLHKAQLYYNQRYLLARGDR